MAVGEKCRSAGDEATRRPGGGRSRRLRSATPTSQRRNDDRPPPVRLVTSLPAEGRRERPGMGATGRAAHGARRPRPTARDPSPRTPTWRGAARNDPAA
eukprot:7690673-Pyramimonas_sp.AAC.1